MFSPGCWFQGNVRILSDMRSSLPFNKGFLPPWASPRNTHHMRTAHRAHFSIISFSSQKCAKEAWTQEVASSCGLSRVSNRKEWQAGSDGSFGEETVRNCLHVN